MIGLCKDLPRNPINDRLIQTSQLKCHCEEPNGRRGNLWRLRLLRSLRSLAMTHVKLLKTFVLVSQAVSASGSVGANYREANDALGKKDFLQ